MNKFFSFFRESQTARMLISIGLILIVFGVFMFCINTKNQDYIKVDAVVSGTVLVEDTHTDAEGNTVVATYNVYVKYSVNGTEYETLLGELSGYKEGDKITIYYDPNDPNNITQTKSLLLPIGIIVGGLAAFIGGIVSGANAIKKHKRLKEQEKGWKNE